MSRQVVNTHCVRKMLIISIVLSVMAVAPAWAGTDIYKFLADKSTVVQTGGFAGITETYGVSGRFKLTVDLAAETASFDWVEAVLTDGPFVQNPNLGSLFNMTALTATSVTAGTIEFEGKTADGTKADIHMVMTFTAASIQLKGQIKSPCCDLFDYTLDAVVVRAPHIPPPPPPIPVLKYSVASPRACLIGPPIWSTNAYYMPTGAAENFPRKNGSIRVRVGTRVVFCLSRDLENVWYKHSYGCMGNSLVLQLCRMCKCQTPNIDDSQYTRCTCDQCKLVGAVCPEPRPDDPVIVPCPWVTIGKDGSRDCRKGPSIGRAKVGVPVHFKRPGVYLLRAIVHTYARPGYPLPLDQWRDRLLGSNNPTVALPEIPGADDRDTVYIRVRVMDWCIDDIEPEDPPTDDPDLKHIRPMPKDIDPSNPVDPVISDLNGDEVINLADLAIMAQQWGRTYEMPFTDDE